MGTFFRIRLASAVFLWAALCTDAVHSAWRPLGDAASSKRAQSGVILEGASGARLSASFYAPDVVRIRLSPDGAFEEGPNYAWDPASRPGAVSVDVRESSSAVELVSSGGARMEVRLRPLAVRIFDRAGRLVLEDDPAKPYAFDPETGEVESSKIRGELQLCYGFGEKALPMSRHGKRIVMWNTDTFRYPAGADPIYQDIPFYMALEKGLAYGLFLNNTHRTYFDTGLTETKRLTFGAAAGELDFFVFLGGEQRSPEEVLRQYAQLTGRTPLPPLWALGNQQSRWSYFPQARVQEVAREFRSRRLPLDVLYLDIDYMDEKRIFTWDKERFPEPAKLLAALRSEGIRTVLIEDPGVKADENYGVYKQGRELGAYVRAADNGEFHASVWPGSCAFPDFTDPKAREWFGSLYKGPLDDGVSGFWNDMNEPATFLPPDHGDPEILHHPGKTFPLDARHAGDGKPGSHARYHNVYGMLMARSTFEGLRRLRPNARPFVLTRAGFAGVQRYAAVWTGDSISTWEHLALTIPMLANMSVSGLPFVGADVGGFSGEPSGELYARWLQAAALTPFLRSHYNGYESKDKEPWAYGPDFESINRASLELRYRFLPYLYTLFRLHEKDGLPVLRPLWFHYPKDNAAALIEDEYLVGRDLLAAPVITEGQRKREVYFPKGDDWVDWWSGKRYAGGSRSVVDAPLDRLPLFGRAGSVIPTQAPVQNTDQMRGAPLTLAAFGPCPKTPVVSEVYQDAGDGYAYRGGDWSLLRIECSQGRLLLTRSGKGPQTQPVKALWVLGAEKPKEIQVDGRSAPFIRDEKDGRLSLDLPASAGEVRILP
ncbi:MAG: TIM-barrel domain-containing protein [Elusimicrobiota bacterium]|jgi:alpha-glucosidase